MSAPAASALPTPRHVAIILDGNGRWANKRGLPRVLGHKYGAERVREIVRSAGKLGIEYLTLFALSLDNRKRPPAEVSALYGLLEEFARSEQAELRRQGARVEVIGDLGSLPDSCQRAITRLCEATADGRSMVLRLAVAYGAREDIAQATRRIAQRVAAGELKADAIGEETLREHMWTAGAPNPDLVIRTGGERRLSDFLLLEAAYAELYFTDVAWPDFDADELRTAVNDFTHRDRRFGLVKTKPANGSSVTNGASVTNGFEGLAQAGGLLAAELEHVVRRTPG
jgi:undecaprenyl diphosphate synthase